MIWTATLLKKVLRSGQLKLSSYISRVNTIKQHVLLSMESYKGYIQVGLDAQGIVHQLNVNDQSFNEW